MTREATIQVLDLLDAFAKAMSERDVEATVDCVAPGPSCVLIGSGPDEHRVGDEELRTHFSRDFAQPEWLTMRWIKRGVAPISEAFAAWGIGEIEAGEQASGRDQEPLRVPPRIEVARQE